MARAFTEREKEHIRKELLEQGHNLIGQYGLKKTSIKELADAVGISPGSFYSFFNSKEELFFAIVEQEEESIKGHLMAQLKDRPLSAQVLKDFLLEGLDIIDSNPIFKRLYLDNDYQRMLRKLPPENIQAHIKNDNDVLMPLVMYWQKQGLLIEKEPQIISGALRALFTLTLHKQEIGEDIFPQVMELIVTLLAEGLVTQA